MADLSKLSDQELMAMHTASQAAPDLSKMSDQELLALHAQQQPMSAGKAALKGAEQGVTLGFWDELQGGVEGAGRAVGLKGLGGPVKDISLQSPNGLDASKFSAAYQERRDQLRGEDAQAKAEHPGAHFAGNLAGGIVPSLLVPGSTTIGGAAATGAGIGGLAGLGSSEAKTVGGLAVDTAIGTALGGTIGAGFGALGNSGKNLAGFAEKKAFKSSGAMLKDYRSAADEVHDIGRFMLDKGLVKAGDTFENVAQKSTEIQKTTGEALGRGYDAASMIISRLKPDVAEKVAAAGFNPVRDKGEIIAAATKELGYGFKAKAAIQGVSDYIDTLAAQHGDQTLNPQVTNSIKTALDKTAIHWQRNPLLREPDTETAVKALRGFLSDKVSTQIDAVGKAIGDTGPAEKLAGLNATYGMSTRIANIAEDRVFRESANRMFGLTDTLAGGFGAAAGQAAKGNVGSAIGMVGGAVGNKLGRTYGNAVMAHAADATAKVLEHVPVISEVARLNPAIAESLVDSFVSRAGPVHPRFSPTMAQQTASNNERPQMSTTIRSGIGKK